MTILKMHELIQTYFDKIYSAHKEDINKTLLSKSNELYGELYYYSVVKLVKCLEISEKDHFLDIGSGLGKLIFQLFLTTEATSVTGIEINTERHKIASQIKTVLEQELPSVFNKNRHLNLLQADFLKYHFTDISIAYVCSTVFSFELINAISKKLNDMESVKKIVSLRKLPNLYKFRLIKKLFLHGTWDYTPCYLYTRN